MNLPIILLGLRILSALLLITFLIVVAWIAYQDMRYTAEIAESHQIIYGHLRIITNDEIEKQESTVYPLQSILRIGRGAGNSIVIDNEYVSNAHAIIERRERQWWISDLDSRNGTMLNGKILGKPTIISYGDVIEIGETHLLYEQASSSIGKSTANEV